ncbi:MAG TPA: BON domain-containing protein [Candidatus Dormibacteraeota bacterium]|nr:BON domain-containing protein [Candidatus Dormibacteraeota bacterium]
MLKFQLKFKHPFLSLTFISSVMLATLVPGSAWARGAPSYPAQNQSQNSSQGQAETEVQLIKEVRHVLVMQPFYTVFDNLAFKVNGEEVTLLGEVVRPVLKSDAASAVKKIEGVTSVKNEIKVLPPSPGDNRIRRAEFRAIYSNPGFEKYAIQAVPPIHIIVDMGHVTLTGVVANQMDKTLAITRANQVPGVIGRVTDQLRVENAGK